MITPVRVCCSIAGALRSEFNVSKSSEMSDRTQYLFKLATHLKWLADTFRISVLLVNQVLCAFLDLVIFRFIIHLGKLIS